MIILQPEILLHVVQLKKYSTGFGEMFTYIRKLEYSSGPGSPYLNMLLQKVMLKCPYCWIMSNRHAKVNTLLLLTLCMNVCPPNRTTTFTWEKQWLELNSIKPFPLHFEFATYERRKQHFDPLVLAKKFCLHQGSVTVKIIMIICW